MKHKKIHGKYLLEIKNTKNIQGNVLPLHEGDGELVGVGCEPDMQVIADLTPTAIENLKKDKDTNKLQEELDKRNVYIYCHDNIKIIEINRNIIQNLCDNMNNEKKTKGINYLQPHYSNMVDINFKFKQKLSVSGNVEGLVFYIKY